MKKILFGFFVFFCATAFPFPSHAQTPSPLVPFGGLEVALVLCTCSPYNWHYFAPLSLGTAIPTRGPSAKTPTLFSFYVLHPKGWALGFETPGVQACWMVIPHRCAPLAELGVISPVTGVSP